MHSLHFLATGLITIVICSIALYFCEVISNYFKNLDFKNRKSNYLNSHIHSKGHNKIHD